MNNTSSFLVQNKIITIDQIKEVSEYLKKTLDYYKDLIAQDYERNNNASFYSGHYKYYVYVKPIGYSNACKLYATAKCT